MRIISVLKQKYQAWRAEIDRRRKLEAEMQRGLIDPTLLARATINATAERIAEAGLRGMRQLEKQGVFVHPSYILRPLPEIDPAYRKGRTAVLGERAGY